MKTIDLTYSQPTEAERIGQSWREPVLVAADRHRRALKTWSVARPKLELVVPMRTRSSAALVNEFAELARAWRTDTGAAPFVVTRVMHWAYQRIIGMGAAAIPLILEDLQNGADHWFWALNAITGEDPAAGLDEMHAAADAWLQWGRANGFATD